MDRERAKQLLPIIQAYAKGGEVQVRNGGEWVDLSNPCWMSPEDYRIKPKVEEFYAPIFDDGTSTGSRYSSKEVACFRITPEWKERITSFVYSRFENDILVEQKIIPK